jgi:hypothetical protein
LQLVTGAFVIANFGGEQNAMPTPVAAQATLLVIATGSIVGASAAFAIGHLWTFATISAQTVSAGMSAQAPLAED